MKVNPQQAPLYGNCVLAVQLSDEELAQVGDVEGVEFYLLFSGSRQTHLSTTLRDPQHGSLQATCPAHDCCESVLLTLCAVRAGGGALEELGRARLQFVQDLAFDMAQYLVSTVGRPDGLDGVPMLDECQIPLQECERLDHSLALALRHLHLPDGWNLLGDHLGKDTDPEPQETLLHFACGRGLLRVASFLLHQRGALEALRLPNKDGYTPASLAQSRGQQHILELLSREGVECEAVSECLSCGDGVLEHHPVLGTYTLSLSTHTLTHTLTHPEPGTGHPSLEEHLQQLGRLIQHHIQGQPQHYQGGACVQRHEQLENKPERPELKLECVCESENTGSEERRQQEECVQECRGAGGGERLESEEEESAEPEQHDPLSPAHEQQAADNDNTESPGEDTHSHAHKSSAREHTLSSEQGEEEEEEEELSGEHGAPRVRPRPRPPLVSTQTSSQPTAEGLSDQDGQEEECVLENTERDNDSSPATTATEEKLGEESKEEYTGVEEEEEKKEEEYEVEDAGLEESGATPPDTTDTVSPPDSTTDPPEELSPGEGPRIGELSGQSAGEEAAEAPGIIFSALGGSEGGRDEGDDRGPQRDEEEEEEEEEEKLPDQKHPSGLGGLADAAETRETAESPETAETAVGSGDTEPADQTTAAAAADMGLTQSLQDLESSDTDSGDCSQDEETGRDGEDEGEGGKHEHEAREEEEGESREENEEFVDASSTSVEAENSLFVECSDSVPEATTHPSPQPEEPGLQEEAVSPQSRIPEQSLMGDGSHEELSPEAEVEVDQTAISTRPVDGSVETETLSHSDHCSDSAEATLSEEVESPGEQQTDGLAEETVAGGDGDCNGDITSPVSDSGCDLPLLVTDPDVTSLYETAESSSDTHLHDSTETDLSKPLTTSADTEEDLEIPECQAESLCEKAETEQEVTEEEQDQELQPSVDTPDGPEMAEASQVEGEAHSDASVTHSEDSRPASSDDTLEGLDEDSSTMSESEPQKQDVRAGQGAGTRVSDAQVGEAPVPDASDGHVSGRASAGLADNITSYTVDPEVAMDTEMVSLSDAMVAAEEPPAEGVSHTHTHTHTLTRTDSGDKQQPELEQHSRLSECEGVEMSAVCVPEETHTLEEQGEVATPKSPSEAFRPEQVSEQVTAGVIGGVTAEVATALATQALKVPVAMETTQKVPEEVVEEVAKAGRRDRSTDEAPSSAGERVDSERQADMLTAAGALDCTTDTQPSVGQTHGSISLIHREKESFPAAPDTHTVKHHGLEKGTSIDSTDSPQSSRSSISTLQRDSGSDTDGFCSTDTGEDNVFRKGDDTVTGDSTSEVSVSCSSTDDAASLGHPSSTSSSSSSSSSRLLSGDIARRLGAGGGIAGGVDTEEEAKDCVSDVPLRSALLRSSIRSLSPFRRHSWGPGKNGITDGDMNQRSALPSYGDAKPAFHRRSLSLEGLAAADGTDGKAWHPHQSAAAQQGRRVGRQESEERGSLVSLTEEEHESDVTDCSSLDSQKSRRYQPMRRSVPAMTLPLTKSVSMLAISQRDIDAIGRIRQKRRISFAFNFSPILPKSKRLLSIPYSSSDEDGDDDDDDDGDTMSLSSFSSTTGSVDYSITEEEPGPLRGDFEGKSGTKVSRTFSYLKNKMYKKTREKDKDRHKEREKETKEKRINGHFFSHVGSVQPTMCPQCHKAISSKEAFVCSSCYVCVHKGCRESLPICAKVKMKLHKQQPFAVPDSATLPAVTLRPKPSGSRERPRSAIMSPDEHSVLTAPRRHTLMPFNSSNLSKSISISNIAGPVFDEIPLRGLRYLSQSTDSLHKPSKVNESTESLVDEGTDMIDSQLMGEFEADARELEADSWSNTVDKKYLKQLKKDSIKRQDVIYELMQTEMHHVRTLRVMAEVYCKGLQKEVQLEAQTLERMFPMLDELLDIHTHFLSSLLERKRDAQLQDGAAAGGFLVERIGDLLVNQFSGSNADSMKRVYGKFCGRHNEAVNLYKEHHAKDKRFQAFIRRKMSSSIVRRMGIPECILLVTQRITKYPVLLQRILQHTRENEEDHAELSQALGLVKEVIVAVDLRVSEQEKRRRLKEIHARTDSKSIMRMKSGQMFAREDLLRGRRLLHDGPLQLKNATGRLKDVQALLLSDILVFLQEKDQKYIFASLDQRSTVISLQKLIVREVANEERALFLITAGMERPEMVEVHASSKDERNAWMQLLQNAMQSIEKDEDEGIPSETEEDKRLMESKAKELREVLKKKDDQIVNLLQEKIKLFRDMCDCGPADDGSSCSKMLFRACNDEVPKGEPIMKDALKEVETLQLLVNGSLGGAVGQQVAQEAVGGVGPVTLPRRAETFGGFDSHQMNISKNGDREDGEDTADLRRTESDSVLKKGGNANLLLLLKRNSEQVLHSVTNLHDLLASLQAVVVQQDTFIEDQRQALSERPPSSASCSSSTASGSSSRPSSRPNSLIEQERQRSLEKQRQEATALQRQQAAHAEEKRKRERQWEARESHLAEREASTQAREEELHRRRRELEQARLELQAKKEDYQRDLERLRDGQRRLERDKDHLRREAEALEQLRMERRMQRTPSSTSEDSLQFQSGISSSLDPPEASDSDPPRKNSLSRLDPKPKGRTLNPFSLNSGSRSQSGECQIPSRLLQLTRSKDKKDKKKKKSKHPLAPDSQLLPLTEPSADGEIYFC